MSVRLRPLVTQSVAYMLGDAWRVPLNRARTMRHAPMCGSKNFMRARVLPVFLVSGVKTLSTMLQPGRRRIRGN
jgi:hypothetical protein